MLFLAWGISAERPAGFLWNPGEKRSRVDAMPPPPLAKGAGYTSIWGNFLILTHAFRLVTDDPGLIARLSAAIDQSKATPDRQKMLDALLYLDHWKGINHNAITHGAAFYDCDQLPATINRKL